MEIKQQQGHTQVLPFCLWVDADALPKVLKELLVKVSDRKKLPVIFVANQPVGMASSYLIKTVQVEQGADKADQYIVQHANPVDIVMTQDIPLAAQVVEKGCIALNPRGDIYTMENIKARLHMRDFMDMLRGSGVQTGGSATFGEKDKKSFADSLEKIIVQRTKSLKSF